MEFSRRFGDLDDIRPYLTAGRKLRYDYLELFDAGNIDENGGVLDPDAPRSHYGKVCCVLDCCCTTAPLNRPLQGNGLFHVDSSFNPRRASYSLLRAFEIPPPGHGGNTEFADTRTAFDELPEDLKDELISNDYVAAHSLFHSRKNGSPDFFKDLNPLDHKMHRHRIVQRHEPSGRQNLYIAAHAHHIEKLSPEESEDLLQRLMKHATQSKYVVSIPWVNVGDLVIWDNTCVMHRAAGGTYEGRYRRDLRRTTVHDGSSQAWGLNEQADTREGFNPVQL